MKFLPTHRRFAKKLGQSLSENLGDLPAHPPTSESPILKTVGWVSAALGTLAVGLLVGREIRLRYKFNRRTPYDLYAHSGDRQDLDFGIGI